MGRRAASAQRRDGLSEAIARAAGDIGDPQFEEVSMHLSSLELRWFWSGELANNQNVRASFENFDGIKKRADVGAVGWSKPREDVYLVIPSAVDLGIKWREGELQTKGRRAVLGEMVFGNDVRGVVEQWTKWTHEGPNVDAAFKRLFSGNVTSSITVWKRRALRKVRLDPFGPTEEVLESEHIERGVNCELTDLKVNGAPYFSVAFEAFPDDAEMPEQFTQVVNAFLGGFDRASFNRAESKSYPAWLDALSS